MEFEGYRVEIVADNDHGSPWEENDGHGPVSEWTQRGKEPGEYVLCEDRGSFRYYDFAEACRIARRDGWGSEPYNVPGESKRERAARAALADFDHLRRWCAGDWHYVGVVVRPNGACRVCGPSASLWGIESESFDYMDDVARDLIEELEAEAVEA